MIGDLNYWAGFDKKKKTKKVLNAVKSCKQTLEGKSIQEVAENFSPQEKRYF